MHFTIFQCFWQICSLLNPVSVLNIRTGPSPATSTLPCLRLLSCTQVSAQSSYNQLFFHQFLITSYLFSSQGMDQFQTHFYKLALDISFPFLPGYFLGIDVFHILQQDINIEYCRYQNLYESSCK